MVTLQFVRFLASSTMYKLCLGGIYLMMGLELGTPKVLGASAAADLLHSPLTNRPFLLAPGCSRLYF